MSNTIFTKGPWLCFEEEPGISDTVITTQERELNSQVCIVTIDVDFDGRIGDEQQANASLITAAPDLYEALEVILSIEVLGGAAKSLAEDALAKARGEL